MANEDRNVRLLVKYYTTAELEAAQLAILQADMSMTQDVVQITSQSSRAGSATGTVISPQHREYWQGVIEKALAELTGTTAYLDKWHVQDLSSRTFGT